MRSLSKVVLLFALSLPCFAGTGEAYVIGFGAGIAFKLIPFTNNHVVLPTTHAIQRAAKMTPEDRQRRKLEKARRKSDRNRQEPSNEKQ